MGYEGQDRRSDDQYLRSELAALRTELSTDLKELGRELDASMNTMRERHHKQAEDITKVFMNLESRQYALEAKVGSLESAVSKLEHVVTTHSHEAIVDQIRAIALTLETERKTTAFWGRLVFSFMTVLVAIAAVVVAIITH